MSPLTKLMLCLLKLSPYEFTLLSVVLGYIFSDGIDNDGQQALGNFFENIGQVILTISSQAIYLDENKDNIEKQTIEDALVVLRKKIENIDEIISDLKNLKF